MTACPSPLWQWYPAFESWCEAGRLPAERPKTLPFAIPKRAFDCYRERHPHPVHDYGLLAKSGCFVREPTGGNETEKVPAAKAAGFQYLALNTGDYTLARWEQWRILAHQADLPVVPWKRCYTVADLKSLEADAQDMAAQGMAPNIENEAETTLTPAMVAAELAEYHGSLAVVTDFRGYADASGYHGPDWRVLADRGTGIIENFTNDDQARSLDACAIRARMQGWKSYVPLLDTKLDPTAYTQQSAALTGARAIYTLDIVDANDLKEWMT